MSEVTTHPMSIYSKSNKPFQVIKDLEAEIERLQKEVDELSGECPALDDRPFHEVGYEELKRWKAIKAKVEGDDG